MVETEPTFRSMEEGNFDIFHAHFFQTFGPTPETRCARQGGSLRAQFAVSHFAN
jgi:hypothetical protein